MAQQGNTSIQSVPLAVNFGWRGVYSPSNAVKDAWAKNVFVEKEADGPYSVKRPGMAYSYQLNTLGLANTIMQGGWISGNNIGCVVMNDEIISLPVGVTPATIQSTVPLGSQPAGQWYKSLHTLTSSAGVDVLQSPYAVYTGTVASVTQVILPNGGYQLCPGIAELDASLYCMDIFGHIWSSSPNIPGTWPALNFVTTDPVMMQPLALARHLNYIVAFGSNALQLFYDAGISPGSVLAGVQGGIFLQGMAPIGQFSLAETDDSHFWLGTADAGNLCILMLTGLQVQRISTPAVERFLQSTFIGTAAPGTQASSVTIRGFTVKAGGHSFYILTNCSPLDTTGAGSTIVYDITTQTWTVWTQQSLYTATSPAGSLGTTPFEGPVRAWGSINAPGAFPLLPDMNNGRGLQFTDLNYQDDSQTINVLIQTDLESWGSQRVKFLPATYLLTDTTPTSLMISWTDDDYQTFSTPQVVSGANTKKQFIRCGSTIERAWQVTHADNSPMRFYSVEVEVQAGAL